MLIFHFVDSDYQTRIFLVGEQPLGNFDEVYKQPARKHIPNN